jgi:hypothetical protein
MLDVYGLERRPAFHESLYMVYSTLHWKPLVNGYAGIEPKRYVEIRNLAREFPSEAFLAALRGVGTRYVIVHRKGYGPFQWERLQRACRGPGERGAARGGGAETTPCTSWGRPGRRRDRPSWHASSRQSDAGSSRGR